MYNETLPLFLMLDVKEGGFGFNSQQIGVLISSAGLLIIFFNLGILPRIIVHSKSKLFFYSIVLGVFTTVLWPLISILDSDVLVHRFDSFTRSILIWTILISVNFIKSIVLTVGYTAVIIQVNHSVSSDRLGAVNGLAQGVASFFRMIGPLVGGALWSFGVVIHMIYFNFAATACCFVLTMLVNSPLSTSLDEERQKKLPQDESLP
jgi:hypothetical protein